MIYKNVVKGRFRPHIALGTGIVHLGACIGVRYGFVHGFSWTSIFLAIAWYGMSIIGITVGYHRLLTHGAFQCHRSIQWILIFLGGHATEGPAENWCTDHTQHHAYEDQPGDPHSPGEYGGGLRGFLWSHFLWFHFETLRPAGYRPKFKWESDPMILWQARWNWAIILVMGFVLPYLIAGWDGVFLAGFIRIVAHWHITWSVNSVCHLWGSLAPGTPRENDRSRNNIIIAFLSGGEGFHAYHHKKPNCAYMGWRWYHYDPGKWVIALLARLRWAWEVNTPVGLRYRHILKTA